MKEQEQIRRLMENLELTEDEARQLYQDDKRIDRGEKLFELPKDKELASKKIRQTTGKKGPTVYNFDKRARKENPTKRELIQLLFEALKGHFEQVEITNPERVIALSIKEDKFEITLSQKRKPKT